MGQEDKNPAAHTRFILEAIEAQNAPEEARRIMNLESQADKIQFIRAIAQRIWHSDFESYSRFSGAKLRYKRPATKRWQTFRLGEAAYALRKSKL